MSSQQFTAYETRRADGRAGRIFRSARAFSSISQADAQQKAAEQAQATADAAASSTVPPLREAYPYGVRDHVLAEPEIASVVYNDTPVARITRNSYGASVLNAANVMFVDVDIAADGVKTQDEALALLDALVAVRPDFSFRVYATTAGLRYLCTSRLFQPETLESEDVLKCLKSDKRYVLLCRKQKCYRARLTPKPWRCYKKITVAPPATPEAALEPQGFLATLLRIFFRSDGTKTITLHRPEDFATCRYIKTVGANVSTMLPEIAEIVRVHDEQCCVSTDKPLA